MYDGHLRNREREKRKKWPRGCMSQTQTTSEITFQCLTNEMMSKKGTISDGV